MNEARTMTQQTVIIDLGMGQRKMVEVRTCNYGDPIIVVEVKDDDKVLLDPCLLLTIEEAEALARYLSDEVVRTRSKLVASSK